MLVLATFLTAVFPPLLLTGFFLTQYRRRLGLRLGIVAFGLGLVAAGVALVLVRLAVLAGLLPAITHADSALGILRNALVTAGLYAAVPEELAKFLMVWFVIRRSKDCDSGGDLFCGAILVSLGFAALENVLYIAPAGAEMRWAFIGVVRAVMAIPGHTIDGMFMGYFLALWWRGAIPHWAALLLALALPMAAHTFYDFPLIALDTIARWQGVVPLQIDPALIDWLRFMQFGVMGVSALGAIWVARRELVDVYRLAIPDGDLYAAEGNALRWWRWIGWGMASFGTLVGGFGIAVIFDPWLSITVLDRLAAWPAELAPWLIWLFHRETGEFLFGMALFPLAFAAILQMRPPARVDNLFAIWPSVRPWQ
jgi:RsiW-degrading membrane proteinase PrsW (M82 family)